MKAPNRIDRYARDNRYVFFLLSIVRYGLFLFNCLLLALVHKGKRSIVIFALPKSGSTAIEHYVQKIAHLPTYIPLSGIIADFSNGSSHATEISKFDMFIIETCSVFVKTHLLPPQRELDSAKVCYVGLTRNIEDAADSCVRHLKRYPRLSQLPFDKVQQSFYEWESKVKLQIKLFDIANFGAMLDVLNREVGLELTEDGFARSTASLAEKYPEHFKSLGKLSTKE